MHKITIIFFVATLFSCSNNQSNGDKNKSTTSATKAYPVKPLQIDNGEEEGWGADIRLSIINIDTTDNGIIYKAQSSFQEKNVGVTIEIPNNNENTLLLKSEGSISDNLLAVLSQLYKLHVDSAGHFGKSIQVSYVDLHSFAKEKFGANDIAGQMAPQEYKLFFHGKRDQDYAEFYLNINDEEHWLELREKDPEYRLALIKFLGGR